MLACHNLCLHRGPRQLFAGLGLCLPQGSLVVVKGGNGIGKTSLLQALAGLLPTSSGEVLFEDTPIQTHETYSQRLCYIGSHNGLKESETILQNLEFYAAMNGNAMMLPAALKFFDLEPRADTQVRLLSSGFKRRVAMARLLLGNYTVWLLDEPTNFLDNEGVALLTSLIESRVHQGGIVVVASHTMGSQFAAHMLQLEDFT